jgi:hypothetical protein
MEVSAQVKPHRRSQPQGLHPPHPGISFDTIS